MTDNELRLIVLQASYIEEFEVQIRDLNWRYLSIAVLKNDGGDVVQSKRIVGDGSDLGELPSAAAECGSSGGTGDWPEDGGAAEQK